MPDNTPQTPQPNADPGPTRPEGNESQVNAQVSGTGNTTTTAGGDLIHGDKVIGVTTESIEKLADTIIKQMAGGAISKDRAETDIGNGERMRGEAFEPFLKSGQNKRGPERDFYSDIKCSSAALLSRLGGPDHPRYRDASSLLSQLDENIDRLKHFGPTNDLNARRAELISYLDNISLDLFTVRFVELCQPELSTLSANRLCKCPDPQKPEEVKEWFSCLGDARHKYFVILLAMFDGLKWSEFSTIYNNWIRSKKLADDKVKVDPFEETDEDLLRDACAVRIRKDDKAADFIEFRDWRYPSAVFELLRRFYRNQLNELLSYLQQLGTDSYWEVRARASQAVAEIAKGDFYLARQAFEVWAKDDRPFVRAAVGYAAAKLVKDNVAVDQLHRMLRDWSRPEALWKLAWAAASACKQIGLDNPAVALEDLQLVASYDDIRVTDSVAYALVVISLEDHLDKVIGALRKWIESADQVGSITATLAFLVLASGYTEVALDEAKAKAKGEPIEEEVMDLLQLLAENEAERITAAYLLVRAFEYKLKDQAFDIIAGWARQSADNLVLQNTACSIVVEMYREIKPPRRADVLAHLGKWETGKDKKLAQFAVVTKAKIKTVMLNADSQVNTQTPSGKSIVFG